jgi:hypothetical protein
MQIRLSNMDRSIDPNFGKDLENALDKEGLSNFFRISQLTAAGKEVTRGIDPVSVATVLLTAVGAGGALTVAIAKEGFLTRLAKVLEMLAARQVEITVESGKEKFHLSGSASHIERILRTKLK